MAGEGGLLGAVGTGDGGNESDLLGRLGGDGGGGGGRESVWVNDVVPVGGAGGSVGVEEVEGGLVDVLHDVLHRVLLDGRARERERERG